MLSTYEQHSKRKLIATLMTIIVIAGAVLFADHAKSASTSKVATTTTATTPQTSASTESTATTITPTTTSTPTATPSTTSTSAYKDGTYTATSSYYVPHGSETIQVSLTLSNGVITDSSIVNSESDHESAAYQQDFASAYKNYVVGKQISGLQLGVIAGASDTSQGFDDALTQIVSKAQA